MINAVAVSNHSDKSFHDPFLNNAQNTNATDIITNIPMLRSSQIDGSDCDVTLMYKPIGLLRSSGREPLFFSTFIRTIRENLKQRTLPLEQQASDIQFKATAKS